MLTRRKSAMLDKVTFMRRTADVIAEFIAKGFDSKPAVVAIAQHHDPTLSREDIVNFWHTKTQNFDVLEKMERVLIQLSAE